MKQSQTEESTPQSLLTLWPNGELSDEHVGKLKQGAFCIQCNKKLHFTCDSDPIHLVVSDLNGNTVSA